MKTVDGDLIALALSGNFDVIVHGCNCFCSMDAGIAKSIKSRFPAAYQADSITKVGDRSKLGNYTAAKVQIDGQPLVVINAYTQYHWQGHGNKTDYQAIQKVFNRIKVDFPNQRIGYPMIGAGLAGGNWEIIASIIESELEDMDHTFVRYSP